MCSQGSLRSERKTGGRGRGGGNRWKREGWDRFSSRFFFPFYLVPAKAATQPTCKGAVCLKMDSPEGTR